MFMKTRFLLISILASTYFLSGCNSNSSSGTADLNSAASTTTTTSSTTTTLVNKVVTVGAGINFNAQTGSWSELAIDPILKTPGVVYYDRSAYISAVQGALKYAKMNGAGSWDVEIVDTNAPVTATTNTCGGGATSANCIGAPNVAVPTAAQPQIYDIGFLNYSVNAQPVIAYAYGSGGASSPTSGKSVRVATRTSSGTWNIETAVSGTQVLNLTVSAVGPVLATTEYAIRGVRTLVDDSNRVHLYFAIYAATANNSVYAYTMKKTDGTWTTPVVVSSTTPSTLAFVAGAPTIGASGGMLQAGAAWCKYTGGGSSTNGTNALLSLATMDNTPAASTQGFLLRCSASATDGSCTTWQGLDYVAGCAGACLSTTPAMAAGTVSQFGRSDITVDPTTGRIILNYFHAAPALTTPVLATGIVTTRSPAACDSGLSTTAWATARYHPTAAQGTMGFKAASDGTDVVLTSLVAATGTSVIASKLTTALAANWNVSPDQTSIENTTGVYIGGGLAYDSSTGVYWGSYGALTASAAGAAGQDLKVYGLYSADVSTTAPPVSQWFVDQTNSVAQPTAVPMLDAAKAPNGTYGYVYFYQEPGTAQGVNSHLYYGTRGGTKLAPVFGEKIVSSSLQGLTTVTNGIHPSLAYDSQSNPVIAFLDQGTVASTGFLTVARSSNAGTSFSIERVDGSTAATNNVGQYTSAAVSSSDTVGVSYYDYSSGATGQRLKFAKRQKNGTWRRYIVDGPGSAGANGCSTTATSSTGLYSRMKWTSAGRPVIAYQSSVAGVKSLRIAFATEAESSSTYTWTCLTIDTGSQGSNTRGEGISFILNSSDTPYIAHYDAGVGALRVVTCGTSGGVISCGQAGASAFTGERPNYIIGTVQSIASRPGIQVTSNGKIFVSFHGPADQGVYYATKENGSWASNPTLVEGSPGNANSNLTGTHGVLLLMIILNL